MHSEEKPPTSATATSVTGGCNIVLITAYMQQKIIFVKVSIFSKMVPSRYAGQIL